ncbi:MAG: hypothetical protein ABI321_10525 [Polyangia bacterium]
MLLSVTASPVLAQSKGARQHYASGTKHFDLGEYRQALEEFKEAYRLKEDPVFLFNIAQCHRLIGDADSNVEALRFYRSYLNRAPDAPNRRDVDAKIVALQQSIADEKAKAEKAEAPPRSPVVEPVTPELAVAATPAPHKQPVYKKWWVWTIVGVAVVGIGVGLGVGLGTRSSGTASPFNGVTF